MDSMSEDSKILYALLQEYTKKSVTEWLQSSLFTWQWWLGVAISIVPWIIWIYIRDKKNTKRLLFIALFAMIFAFVVNTIGVTFGLWFYEYEIFPAIHIYFPWDYTLIPVSIMILLQIKPNSYSLIKGLFYATFSAFVAEPIFHELKHFHPINWRYAYSFVLYFILFLICNILYIRKNSNPLLD